ncbi:hypothetical protein [uncultured Bacteroides sp.]|uniref:hypothetical protein n=1 Tax=uncultured Bacteroides sp. TaxID=162156 RepID=UPI002604902E|nr:hypothetical protein [uncultured Bacteroides sp.]
MKIITDAENVQLYAVGIATGVSTQGRYYQNILVKSVPTPSLRSDYSYYLNLDDKVMMEKLGITDIQDFRDKDGKRKVTKLNEAVPLFVGTLATCEHAPYGIARTDGSGKYRAIRTTTIVVPEGESVAAAADRAIARAYERADVFAKGEEHMADYRKYLHFSNEHDEFERLMDQYDLGE